jgi:5-hydroxyisourate hydrolase
MPISTHILDTSLGRPAEDVPVSLSHYDPGTEAWRLLHTAATNADGRCPALLPPSQPLTPGLYRVRFETRAYFHLQALPTLYPYVEIAFEVAPGESHYHIPLLLTAHGYTTYRGS